MRYAAAVSILVLVVSCRSASVDKMEADVTLKPRTPKLMNQRKFVAVMEFEDKSGYGKGRIGEAAANVLETFLFKSKQFRIIERKKVAQVLQEQKFQHSGAVDMATAVKIGKILKVDYLVYGTVTNFGISNEGTNAVFYQQREQVAESQVDVKLVNVETGELMFAEEGKGAASKQIRGTLGLGGRMGYDETLAGKSLRAAIVKMMDDLIDQAP